METSINSEAKLSSAADCEQQKNCSTGMAFRQTVASEAAVIPLFLGKQRCNITFVVDGSESMRPVLGSVKRLLIQTLLNKALLRDSLFNIITFSGKLNCWSHHMLPCAPDTVYMALSWIQSISCSPGRDLLAALSMAFPDPDCHAIHLLCTELPDQPEAVLTALPALAAGRPLNVFYLQESSGRLDSVTRDYLQFLTQATRGSCYVIPFGFNRELEKSKMEKLSTLALTRKFVGFTCHQVNPLCIVENRSSVPTITPVNFWCPSSSVFIPHSTSTPPLRCSLGNSCQPVTSYMLSGKTLSSEFFPGCRVLARREVDGLYYMGTVIQQVQTAAYFDSVKTQGHGGVWIVDFDHPAGAALGVTSSQRQLVCSLDMFNHTRTGTHCLVPGDTVLSPWEPDLRRYGPGRVMAASERREGFQVDGVTCLRVLMWNSCVSLVPGVLVVPISASQHDRVVRELQIPTSAFSRCCNWLCAHSSSCTPRLFCTDWCPSSSCCSITSHWPGSFPPSYRSSCGRMDGFERAEQDKQVDLKDTDVGKSDPEVPFSSTSSSSSLSEDETRDMFPPAMKLRSKQRPPWKYWRRTGPEPQHRQPGNAVPKRTSQPVRFSPSVPQISSSPNHSSLFQSLPGAKGRRANIRDVFGTTIFKPRPPAGLRPFSGNNATSAYT